MSDIVMVSLSVASLLVSLASLLYSIVSNNQTNAEAAETFAVIGADEGNHDARLERLEHAAGLTVIPSPSALDDIIQEGSVGEFFQGEFDAAREDVEVRAEDSDTDSDEFVPAYPSARVIPTTEEIVNGNRS